MDSVKVPFLAPDAVKVASVVMPFITQKNDRSQLISVCRGTEHHQTAGKKEFVH
jgi:hypothetical protein